MANKILVKRGLAAGIPALSEGELGLATDTEELYIGVASGNKRLDCSYFETIVPLAMNSLQTLTNTQADKAFIASNTRGATGLISTDDAKVQKVFLHLVGVATNTFAGGNALDGSVATDNQWMANLNGGSAFDLKNNTSADGQMLDNDWEGFSQGYTIPFHFQFECTSDISDIDGNIGIKLQNGRSKQSSINVALNAFLRVLWYM